MMKQAFRFTIVTILCAGIALTNGGLMSAAHAEGSGTGTPKTVAKTEPAATPTAAYTTQGFLDAAHDNCAVVQGRSPRSCKCEQTLLAGHRLNDDDKEMAYYFWKDKKEFGKRFEAKKAADAKWHEGFAQRFNNLQAAVISSCGKK